MKINFMKSLYIILLLSISGFNSYAQAEPTIRLRCSATISDNQPLWIMVFKKKNYVLKNEFTNAINPNTIEKLDVLKDAAATALYGVRAANGVIVVTIKKTESVKEYKRLKLYLTKV
ncbi:TonB-dependent receptor plug domain-containing protein [Pedobacter rhodius]|uniref:TonB-dependent receptor plug domain-containing protein n=1 Tax=Pedobacter rhodius TaxID=3004098 RepID=A0ABT4L229_9SPHI|nr:TonB-dependent receptor plug domain-containing protein [Pedobacter sp. SJ11]MCZ4224477.1 TonB-dependent receptor plug domain-containing protein [Pedobacter sp. SJ11]